MSPVVGIDDQAFQSKTEKGGENRHQYRLEFGSSEYHAAAGKNSSPNQTQIGKSTEPAAVDECIYVDIVDILAMDDKGEFTGAQTKRIFSRKSKRLALAGKYAPVS